MTGEILRYLRIIIIIKTNMRELYLDLKMPWLSCFKCF